MLRNSWNLFVVFVFVILAVLDFVPMDFPARMIFPLLWLSLCAFGQRWWALAVALMFSFLGDVMGWKNELIAQIGFFALAQITYIIIFTRLRPARTKSTIAYKLMCLLLIGVVYGVAMFWIFPRVEDSVISYGIAIYALLLLEMCYSALQHRQVWLIIGAILFVASDFILGVHLFVERVPHSKECIMVPYYLGQLLLYIGTKQLYSTSYSSSCSS